MISDYDRMVYRLMDRDKLPTTDEAKLLAEALATCMPGYFSYPLSGSRHEGISRSLNAIFEAERLLNQVEIIKLRKGK